MIYFDNVSKKYGKGSAAVEDITLTIGAKEFVSIVGQSGAGKTTLLRMLLAEEDPTSGNVYFESTCVNTLPRGQLHNYRKRMGPVFQDFRLIDNKTTYENIAFAMEAAGRTDEEIASDVPHILDLVGLGDKGKRFPYELSGGERQRVAIGRAIINQPDVILADEPTGNLDPINTYEIIQILQKINELGTTVILTTHNRDVVDAIGRRVVTMENGKIIRDDKQGRYII